MSLSPVNSFADYIDELLGFGSSNNLLSVDKVEACAQALFSEPLLSSIVQSSENHSLPSSSRTVPGTPLVESSSRLMTWMDEPGRLSHDPMPATFSSSRTVPGTPLVPPSSRPTTAISWMDEPGRLSHDPEDTKHFRPIAPEERPSSSPWLPISHPESAATTSNESLVCESCDRGFKTQNTLIRHYKGNRCVLSKESRMKLIRDINASCDYHCKKCGLGFVIKSSMRVHQQTCSRRKPY